MNFYFITQQVKDDFDGCKAIELTLPIYFGGTWWWEKVVFLNNYLIMTNDTCYLSLSLALSLSFFMND